MKGVFLGSGDYFVMVQAFKLVRFRAPAGQLWCVENQHELEKRIAEVTRRILGVRENFSSFLYPQLLTDCDGHFI